MMNENNKTPNTNNGSAPEQEQALAVTTQPQEVEGYGEAPLLSPMRQVLKRFFRSKLSVIGLSLILFLFAFSFLGPLFYWWGPEQVDESPGRISQLSREIVYTDAQGNTHIIYEITSDQLSQNLLAYPSAVHLLGTDQLGMDVFARIMHGGRISLTIGFVVVFLEMIVGVALGALAGYFGKWVDQLIMRIVDILNCVPLLPILLIASAVLAAYKDVIDPSVRIYFLMVILTFFGWAGIARLVRGQILALREQEFMVATEALGLPVWKRIISHLVPNILPQLIVIMTLSLGGIILTEAALSYMSLGVPPPQAAWGSMIDAANTSYILEKYFHVWVPPGICIIMAVLGFNFLGDGLRDAFDPKAKR